jgi:hypothetical protein
MRVEVTRSALFSATPSDFDDFLYAPIREDRSGLPLSVVSALARLDVDPWDEAAKLAAMSGEAATQRLSLLIASLPAQAPMDPECRSIATRLIALLPQRPVIATATHKNPARFEVAPKSSALSYAVYYVIFMLFILLSQWLIGRRDAPVQGEASTPSAISAPVATPQSSRQ